MTRDYVRKIPGRKSRLLKLNLTNVQTDCDPFSQTLELDFEKLEAAYVPLSQCVRNRINEIVRKYLWMDQSEHVAPYLNDAEAAVRELLDPTLTLLNLVGPNQKSDCDGTKDKDALKKLMRGQIDMHGQSGDFTCARTVRQLEGFRLACTSALEKLQSDSKSQGFVEGRAWSSMILELLELAKKSKLPNSVSNETETMKSKSKFITFIAELQNQLPRMRWSPPREYGSLAKKISDMRRRRELIASTGMR